MSKPKLKIRFVVDVEYEADPVNYPAGSTPEEMLKIDLASAEEDPFMTIEGATNWTTTGEVIDRGVA